MGYKNLAELRQRLQPIMLRRTRAGVLSELPERTTEVIRIPPTEEQLDINTANMRIVGQIAAKPYILEPKQIIRIDVPSDNMGGASKEVNNRRGQILEMKEERGTTQIKAKLPVAQMFGFNSDLKSATGGTGFYWLIDVVYEPLPKDLEVKVIGQIKNRKGITGEEEEQDEE